MIKQLVNYLNTPSVAYLSFFGISILNILCMYGVYKFYKKNVLLVCIFLVTVIGILSRSCYVEPYIIRVQQTEIFLNKNANSSKQGKKVKIALIADLHLGMRKKENFLQRIVRIINSYDIEYLFIAGDLTYYPNKKGLSKLFSPLRNVKVPVYAVLGNHDLGNPGSALDGILKSVLKQNNVKVLNNEIVYFSGRELIGLGDWRKKQSNIKLLEQKQNNRNTKKIVLAHTPDVVLDYTKKAKADLTLVGHTHGGQIHIPLLVKKVIPTKGNFWKGYSEEKYTKLFISQGLGEVGIPLRFLTIPTIDILTLRL